jgi:hypothetical protein
MEVNQSKPNRRWKPFRQVIAQGYKRRALKAALSEQSDEWIITWAATVVLASTTTAKERRDLIDGFASDLSKMSGERVMAIAVALD